MSFDAGTMVAVRDCDAESNILHCRDRSLRVERPNGPSHADGGHGDDPKNGSAVEGEASVMVDTVRLACHGGEGPAGCFSSKEGHRYCVINKRVLNRTSFPMQSPTFACGTAGTHYLELPPLVHHVDEDDDQDEGGGRGGAASDEDHDDDETSCSALLNAVVSRCQDDGYHHHRGGDRRLCSAACHDGVLQAILTTRCHAEVVRTPWGVGPFVDQVREKAEALYSGCGQDLWQTAAISTASYEHCISILTGMWHKCPADSEKKLCSRNCGDRIDGALRHEECFDIHYYRGESKTFRGHTRLLRELRVRACDFDDAPAYR